MHYKNIVWNLIGLGLPLIIAALTVPGLISIVGTERFGLLALAWGLIGYAGALDLGIGRALTQRIATLRSGTSAAVIPDVVTTAVTLTTAIGIAGFVAIILGASVGLQQFIPRQNVPASEITYALLLLALAIPMQAVSATYRGVNEAYLNFRGISLLRVGLGVANFGGPYLIAQFTHELHWLVSTLVASRALALIIYRISARGCLEGRQTGSYAKAQAVQLLRFGGWVTVSSVISPFLVQADRFFVGFLLSAAAVTSYVIPYEITVQAMILVGAVTTVAFPAIAALMQEGLARTWSLFRIWTLRVAAMMAIVMSAMAVLMPTILNLWVGKYVASESVSVGRILCAGVFLNSIGAMFYAYLHAQERAKLTAIFHVIELPLFVGMLYWLVQGYGVIGAAVAWLLRVSIDTLLLGGAVYRLRRVEGITHAVK
ncbi:MULTISPECIES: oligosaccharide flippase family protein [Pseudomonas]|uniref:oligosaccharide flippase family protein n=1 Tax=Pseudomonas TaxID=286 RepID=UPI00048CF697|nr:MULTISPECIES: oligosaccharide flippase family protein [Pseudomonas putida group]